MNGRSQFECEIIRLASLILLAFGVLIAVDCANAANVDGASSVTNTLPAAPAVGTDLLQFLDGSSLHGKLRSVDVEKGIQWQHPGAKQLIEFTPTNIATIGFEYTQPVTVKSQQSCRFRFNNGDEVLGNLTAMDAETLELETWFGGKL